MGRTVRLARPASDADSYLEMRFNKHDWSPFDQRDDWSWTSPNGRYTAAPKITLYRNGRLVWGREPPAA